jgi:Fic family protein
LDNVSLAMKEMKAIWEDIADIYRQYTALGMNQSADYEKYYTYSLICHSTSIEGATLTETETQLLLDEGLTANAKPLLHHLMTTDLKEAYDYAKEKANQQTPVSPAFLQAMNAKLMHTTGSVHHVIGGTFDSSKGEYRLCGVSAGIGGRSYINYRKVPAGLSALCAAIQEKQASSSTLKALYEWSFEAHLQLVSIHPWIDGNGRTARLLMNYLQFSKSLFPAKIFKEDKAAYILSLQQSQDTETSSPFLDFMASQLKKALGEEIDKHEASQQKNFRFM